MVRRLDKSDDKASWAGAWLTNLMVLVWKGKGDLAYCSTHGSDISYTQDKSRNIIQTLMVQTCLPYSRDVFRSACALNCSHNS